jgi:hypothetical protein
MLIDPFHDAAMLLEVTSFFARMSPAGQARAAYGTRIRATCLDDMRSVPSKQNDRRRQLTAMIVSVAELSHPTSRPPHQHISAQMSLSLCL